MAANSAAMTLVAAGLRARHGLLAVTTAWLRSVRRRGCSLRRNYVTASMAAPSRHRSCWLRYKQQLCASKRSPISVPPASRWKKTIAGFQRTGGAVCLAGPDLHASGAAGRCDDGLPPTKASALLDHGARAFCELLADVDKFDPDMLSSGLTPCT